jgi:endonuclease/exonuclease/phosphatase family metal-dependent hydrolase
MANTKAGASAWSAAWAPVAWGLAAFVCLGLGACGDDDDTQGDSAGGTANETTGATDTTGVPYTTAGTTGAETSAGADTAETDDTGNSDGTGDTGEAFVAYPDPLTAPSDVVNDRLCDEAANPDDPATEKLMINCRTEGANFGGSVATPPPVPEDGRLSVWAWNIERGQKIDAQLDFFATQLATSGLPAPDVLLLSEVDRGCSRSGTRNVGYELAEALGMNYVFGVEFIELPREGGSGGAIAATCEHGNAILSRYPLGNVQVLRAGPESQRSWYIPPDERRSGDGEPRLGGRVTVVADALVGDDRMRFAAIHFESDISNPAWQTGQATQAADAGHGFTGPYVAGGDYNAGFYSIDLISGTKKDAPTQVFFNRGFVDAHAGLPVNQRATRKPGGIIDLMLGQRATFSEPGIGPDALFKDLSDHLPVFAKVAIE